MPKPVYSLKELGIKTIPQNILNFETFKKRAADPTHVEMKTPIRVVPR
jgi:hypothetical protein